MYEFLPCNDRKWLGKQSLMRNSTTRELPPLTAFPINILIPKNHFVFKKMKPHFGENHFGFLDYLVVLVTLIVSLVVGIYFAFKGRLSSNNEELLSGSHKMGAIPVAASMLVSYLSAITLLGYPAEVYSYGGQIFLFTLTGPLVTIAAICMFLEVMYNLKLTSAYKYLELRYNSVVVRWLGSLIFITQLLLINGIVLYAPAIALETMMGLPLSISIVAIAVCGTIYTSIGGIKAVVWTDVFQFFMIFIGMSAIVTKAVDKAGGFAEAFKIAKEAGRMQLFDWTIDPFMRHNTVNIFLGMIFADIYFIVHQPVVQRYCSLPTYREAVKSLMFSYLFGIATAGLVISSGVLIFAAYSTCDPVTHGDISKIDQIVPYFVVKELSYIPGMLGLFASVVFSAVLSSISSTLNSLAAVTWEDFLIKLPVFQYLGDFGQTFTYKFLTCMYSVVVVFLAFYAEDLGSIIQASITVSTIAVSIQGSVFMMGVFVPFVNKYGVITGMITSIVTTWYITINAFVLQKKYNLQPKLPFKTEGCDDYIFWNETLGDTLKKNASALLSPAELQYPEKFLTVSYLLYPVIAGIICFGVSMLVSLATGGFRHAKFIRPEYLHKLVRPKKVTIKLSDEEPGQ